MRMRTTGWLMAATVLVVLGAPALRAQECDDGNPCTVNDSCGTDGTCHGTFHLGGSCDDFNDCTINDRCQTVPLLGNVCQGDLAPIDTACGGGCGKCTQEVPGFLFCKGDAADNGKKPCTPPALNHKYCLDQSTCVISPGFVASCPPKPKTCDTFSGCKGSCNIKTGLCDPSMSNCNPCEKCNSTTNTCEATNTGGACPTGDLCAPQGHCVLFSGSTFSYCMASASTGSSPTPTATSTGPTPTPTATSTATVGSPTPTRTTGVPPTLGPCVGDCNSSHSVTVNEIIGCVNIALGTALFNTCPSCSTNGSAVQITDLISAVGSALNGCV